MAVVAKAAPDSLFLSEREDANPLQEACIGTGTRCQ